MRTSSHSRGQITLAGLGIAAIVGLAACSGAATGAPGIGQTIDSSQNGGAEFGGAATAAPAALGRGPDQGLPAASAGSTNPADPATAPGPDADIVRTGSISIEVPKIDPAMLAVRSAIVGLGGYVADSDQTNTADQDDGDRDLPGPRRALAGCPRRDREPRLEGRLRQVERGRGDRPGPGPRGQDR